MEQASSLWQCLGHCLVKSREEQERMWVIWIHNAQGAKASTGYALYIDTGGHYGHSHPGICILTTWKKIHGREIFSLLEALNLKKKKKRKKDAEFNKQMIPMNLQSE